MDDIISPTYVRYIISRNIELNSKKNKMKSIIEGDIIRLFRKITYRENG